MSYRIANKAWDERRFMVPDLMSASVHSISCIISSISSLLTLPKYLLGVDKSRVGNLSSACPESETPMYGRTFWIEKLAWLKDLSKTNPWCDKTPLSSLFPVPAAKFLATPLKSLKNFPDLSIAAMLSKMLLLPCDASNWWNFETGYSRMFTLWKKAAW